MNMGDLQGSSKGNPEVGEPEKQSTRACTGVTIAQCGSETAIVFEVSVTEKETKVAERVLQESERPVVPMKPVNFKPKRNRWREGVAVHWNRRRGR